MTVRFGLAQLETRSSTAEQGFSSRRSSEVAMGLRRCFANHAVEVLVASLDVAPDVMLRLTALLDEAERRRAGRFVFEHDRRRFIVARARLRQALSVRLGIRPEEVQLTYGTHGKPGLAYRGASPNLRFNVSHSGDLVLYAFAEGREVGVDVEAVHKLEYADEIAAQFFSPQENTAYLTLEAADRRLAFFKCWTRKEAFVKALGEGLDHPLDSFDVSIAPDVPARILRVGDSSGYDCGWQLVSFTPAPGYVGAAVVETLTT